MRKLFISAVILCLAGVSVLMSGCGQERTELTDAYALYDYTDAHLYYGDGAHADSDVTFFASDLCVGGVENSSSDEVNDDVATAAAVFSLEDGEVTYAKNIYEKRYPASTTKILTALIALENGDLDQMITVSETALSGLDPASSVCGLKVGDQLTLREALYGLMTVSGNDAACVIAETIAGSQEEFAAMMNEKAEALGCTGSHFVNPHGLPDDDHYTTAYDLYLIFNAAIQNPDFVEIISTDTHEASYKDAAGAAVNVVWKSSDQYLTGEKTAPEGVTVIGGKTGTTNAAGYCLVLYSNNSSGKPVISIVMGGDTRYDLYDLMNGLLDNFVG